MLPRISINIAIPVWWNEPVSLLKSTAVVFLIAVPELMAKAKSIAAQTDDPIGCYLAVAIVYLLYAALRWLERASRIPGFEMEGKKV